MSEIPNTVLGRIEYFEQHIPVWAADPGSIGLNAQQIADITSLTGAARIAYNEAQAARQESKNKTVLQTSAVSNMMGLGTALVATIKAFADASGNEPAVFAAAGISPNNTPAPLAPPAVATDIVTSLLNSGEIELLWKGTTANGTYYTIWRALDDATEFDLIGSVSSKKFVDSTIPAGTARATYFLRTHRDDLVSDESENVFVKFGVSGNTQNTQNTTTGNDTSMNIAA